MSKEFSTLNSYIKRMNDRYFHTLSAFYVFKTLRDLTTTTVAGDKDANNNVDVINTSRNFFRTAMDALNVYFLLELSKFFDRTKKSLRLEEVIDFTENNIHKLTVKDFTEFYQGRDYLEELIKNYKGITPEDIAEIRTVYQKHTKSIEKLILYRNKYLAHDDIEKMEISISYDEIMGLFDLIQEVLEKISHRVNCSFSLWDHIQEECEEDTKKVFEYLKKYEPYRIKEIEDEYRALEEN